jgi:hypothetical protein
MGREQLSAECLEEEVPLRREKPAAKSVRRSNNDRSPNYPWLCILLLLEPFLSIEIVPKRCQEYQNISNNIEIHRNPEALFNGHFTW